MFIFSLFFLTVFLLPLSILLKYVSSLHSIYFCVKKPLGMQVVLHLVAPPPNREVPPLLWGGAGALFYRSTVVSHS